MVGATGIEPVTTAMSTWCPHAHIVDYQSLNLRNVAERSRNMTAFVCGSCAASPLPSVLPVGRV